MKITSNIIQLMKEKKETIRSLSESAGLATQSIVRARGPQIMDCRLSTLSAIADALGVQVKDLFTEQAPPKAATPAKDTKKGGPEEPPVLFTDIDML